MVVKCQAVKVNWVLVVEAVVVPESWRNPEGWRTLKDYVRDNIEKGGQPGKVKILHGKAYIPMLDPIDACMGFNALVGIWWDGWQLTVTLSEHRDGLIRVVAGPSNERFGEQIRIESIHYQRQREPATLRRPRNISSAGDGRSQMRACPPHPEYITIVGPPALSPHGLVEQFFRIQPGSCPDWCFATISCHLTSPAPLQIAPGSSAGNLKAYIHDSSWLAASSNISTLFCRTPTSSFNFEEVSSDSSQGHRRFESSSSNETTLSNRKGPVIARSS